MAVVLYQLQPRDAEGGNYREDHSSPQQLLVRQKFADTPFMDLMLVMRDGRHRMRSTLISPLAQAKPTAWIHNQP